MRGGVDLHGNVAQIAFRRGDVHFHLFELRNHGAFLGREVAQLLSSFIKLILD